MTSSCVLPGPLDRAEAPGVSDPVGVCFYRRPGYGLFDPASRVSFGGAEVRSYTFARDLARRPEFRVAYMVGDEGQPRCQRFGDITVMNEGLSSATVFDRAYAGYRQCCEPKAGFPGFRVRRFRAGLIWQIPVLISHRLFSGLFDEIRRQVPPRPRAEYRLKGVGAFCCFGATRATADIIATCALRGGKTVLFVVHDQEVIEPYRAGRRVVPLMGETGRIIRYCLTRADRVVVQTDRQRELLARNFGRDGTVIRNPIELGPLPQKAERAFVFWVGRAEAVTPPHKRPELLLEIARRCPDVPFLAVMNPTNLDRYDRLVAEKPANVTFIDQVPYAEIDTYYARAAAFLSTANAEGFPNTFLQAAKHAVPIISLAVDPDGMLSRCGAGLVCGDDLDRAAGAIRRLWAEPEYAADLGRAARTYVEREHDSAACGDVLARMLRDLVGRPRTPAG